MTAQVRYTRNLFLRGVCIIYLFAFLSFYIQIPGLYGDNGILPAKTQLDLKNRAPLLQKLKQKPTWLWLAPYLGLNVEYMLDILSLCGILLSFAGFVSQNFCMAGVFAILWSLYYSIYQIGQTFMLFQWDILLLETGFLCIIMAPYWNFHRGKASTPTDALTFLTVRWLLFRLMFSSGVVKLTSGCPVWWKLDALSVHFESQCIPTPLAWYAHHLPNWFLRLSTVAANVIELVVPFLFFFPNRKVRIVAFYTQVFLQLHIIATGNYNFFNFLTICLCISLLDDQYFYKKKLRNGQSSTLKCLSTLTCVLVYAVVLYGTYVFYDLRITDNWTIRSNIAFTPEQFHYALSYAIPISICIGIASFGAVIADAIATSVKPAKGLRNKVFSTMITSFYTVAVCFIVSLSVVPYSNLNNHSHNMTIPADLKQIYRKTEHFHLVNSYGLFRRMTGVDGRPEVIIEGSDSIDGPWKEYEFLYKPGNVNNSLPFVAPHQPRLDWQMWFAALGSYHQNPWLMSLAYRLLSGQPEVLALMNTAQCPFRDRPPKYIKASLYRYHYTPWSQTWNAQAWWTREKVEEYFPIFSHDHPPLIEYLTKLKIIQDKPSYKVTNEALKFILDSVRSVTSRVEASLLLWGTFTAGCAIIMTGYSANNNFATKRKQKAE